jgi:hypothetical protein
VLVNNGEANKQNLMACFMIRNGSRCGRQAMVDGFDMACTLLPCIVLLGIMMPEVDDWTIRAILKANTAARDSQ